jgi:hypothetical protein
MRVYSWDGDLECSQAFFERKLALFAASAVFLVIETNVRIIRNAHLF